MYVIRSLGKIQNSGREKNYGVPLSRSVVKNLRADRSFPPEKENRRGVTETFELSQVLADVIKGRTQKEKNIFVYGRRRRNNWGLCSVKLVSAFRGLDWVELAKP